MTQLALDLFTPPLEERVLVISLWPDYAALVIAGVKTLETRTWPWPYPPRWLVIHVAKREPSPADTTRLAAKLERVPPVLREARGALLGLVYVAGPSRPLQPEDADAACFYEPGRFAWPLAQPTPFAKPVPVPRGPQKFSGLPRADVLRFLRGAADAEGVAPDVNGGGPTSEDTVLAACREVLARDFAGSVLALDDPFPGDSLHRLEAVFEVEERLGVEIPDAETLAWATARELALITERAAASR